MKRDTAISLTLLLLVVAAASASAMTHDVSIADFAFQPADLTVGIGDTVVWTNNDLYPHTVTASDNSFDSGNLTNGATFAHVFTEASDHAYVCLYHSNMTGVIHVAGASQIHEISISNMMFIPAELNINVGDTVRWTNNDAMPHTVTATGNEFDSGNLSSGETFMFVFTADGAFPYVCAYHSNMSGVINVGTTGGGESEWIPLASPTVQPLTDVRFWDENLGWIAGEQGILRTTNGGENWSMQNTSDDVEALFFISESEGWACGNDGMLLHTTNGGTSWSPQNSGVGEKLRDIWFADKLNGWAMRRHGILIYTTDGGQNWDPQSSPATDDLRGIHMLDSQTGWISGSDGLVLFTSNGGSTWTPQLSVPGGEEDEFEAVFALDQNMAWTVGGQGRIYATTDGMNWSPQTSGTGVALMDVFFTSSSSGWACGAGGYLASTMDGGGLWHVQEPPAFASFNAIYFVNENLGFMVGGDGSIYKYAAVPNDVSPPDGAVIPASAELLTNYPNPFNPSTTISFQLNVAGRVQLEVFDILGQRIATLIDAPLAAGTHQAEFSASRFPSGIYFYQLRTAGEQFTRRMMLVK